MAENEPSSESDFDFEDESSEHSDTDGSETIDVSN